MPIRLVVRTLSEVFLTLGTVLLLFTFYTLYWTGVTYDQGADRELSSLRERWSQDSTGTRLNGGAGQGAPPAGAPYREGTAFAVMYAPRLGDDWRQPVLEGTSAGVLQRGLGHYRGTGQLGEVGNFAVAGHRRTHGDPFRDLPRLRPGDAVVLTDGESWFTYQVDAQPYRTLPEDGGVVAPTPAPAVAAAAPYPGPGRYLTLTTGDPEWGRSHRLVVWAHLVDVLPAGQGKPAALAG